MPKKVAIFDIDGTIFRSSLLIETTEALISAGIFPSNARKIYAKQYLNWVNRKDTYDKYLMGVVKVYARYIIGVKRKDYLSIVNKVIAFHRNRVYRYTRDLVKTLKKQGYYLVAISSSPKEMVEKFCFYLGFHKVYARIFEVDKNGRFTGDILFREFVYDKGKMLKAALQKQGFSLRGSVGVGDSESDIPFLKMVSRPICFNPNSILYKHAHRAGWKVVVERKDVIYEM